MASREVFPLLFAFLTLILSVYCEDQRRNITITYNDGCHIPECQGINGTFYNLVHFTALGTADTIHYVWSSIGAPSLLVVRTTSKAKLVVDWEKAVQRGEGVITFEPAKDVYCASAYVISRLLEYDDPKDKADITKVFPNMTRSIDISNLTWSNVTVDAANNTATFEIEKGSEPAAPNGSISFMVKTMGVAGRNTILPHLQHLPNTTEFSLILDNVEQNYNHSRFAVELLIVRDQQMPKQSGITRNVLRSIDDEYTPAVFEMYQVLVNRTSSSKKGNFMQWKPVVYTSSDRTTVDSKPTKVYLLNATSQCILPYSVAQAYFGNLAEWDVGFLNISFGVSKDNFYNATRYYVWSGTMGYGEPPTETISLLVIAIISAGLGIPILLILFGGAFLACQKRKAKKLADTATKYGSING